MKRRTLKKSKKSRISRKYKKNKNSKTIKKSKKQLLKKGGSKKKLSFKTVEEDLASIATDGLVDNAAIVVA